MVPPALCVMGRYRWEVDGAIGGQSQSGIEIEHLRPGTAPDERPIVSSPLEIGDAASTGRGLTSLKETSQERVLTNFKRIALTRKRSTDRDRSSIRGGDARIGDG